MPDYVPKQELPLAAPSNGWSIFAGYGIKAESSPYDFDLLEAELQYDLYLHPQHAITFSLLAGVGGKDHDHYVTRDGSLVAVTDNYDHLLLSFMTGYRFTQPITKRLALEFGAKGGLTIHRLGVDKGRDWSRDYENVYDPDEGEWKRERTHHPSRHNVDVGFGYTAYAGLTFQVKTNTRLHLGYALRSTNTRPKARPGTPEGDTPFRIEPMYWHVIHLGVTTAF